MISLVVAQSAALPAPDAIREKAAEVLARPDFHVKPESAESAFDTFAILLKFLGWILKPFIWVLEMTEGLPALLRWSIVVGLFVLLVLLVLHIGITITRAMRGPVRDKLVTAAAAVTQLDPKDFETRAEQAAQRGEWVDAIRFLFRASLLRLETREKRRFRVGTTNREHLRRYRGTPLFSPIQALVDLIDRKWYRGEDSSAADFEACRQAHAEICELMRGGSRRVHTA